MPYPVFKALVFTYLEKKNFQTVFIVFSRNIYFTLHFMYTYLYMMLDDYYPVVESCYGKALDIANNVIAYNRLSTPTAHEGTELVKVCFHLV